MERPSVEHAVAGSTVLRLEGHLFDSGLINRCLDELETSGGRFELLNVCARPHAPSSALVQISVDGGRAALDALLRRVRALADGAPHANANVHEVREPCHADGKATRRQSERASTEHAPLSAPSARERSDKVTAHVVAASTSSKRLPSTRRRVQRTARGVHARQAHTAAGAAPCPRSSSSVASPRVVVLGAGLCAAPAVEWLSRPERAWHVTVVSSAAGEAQALVRSLGRTNVEAVTLDATPPQRGSPPPCPKAKEAVRSDGADAEPSWAGVCALLAASDAVLSLLPASMHVPIARQCIQARTPLVTASYVSEEMGAPSQPHAVGAAHADISTAEGTRRAAHVRHAHTHCTRTLCTRTLCTHTLCACTPCAIARAHCVIAMPPSCAPPSCAPRAPHALCSPCQPLPLAPPPCLTAAFPLP